jgi:hypothetical protein
MFTEGSLIVSRISFGGSVQVFDNARMAAGILDDPRSMLRRLNSIMTAAISSKKP